MKISVFVLLGSCLVSGVLAQERSAGQAYDAQVNWAALNNKIDLATNQNKLLAGMLDKMNACAKQKKLYVPDDAGADTNGCVTFTATPPKLENAVFKVGLTTDTSAYCQSKGYDVCTDVTAVNTNTAPGGGRGGNQSTQLTGYSITCQRIR